MRINKCEGCGAYTLRDACPTCGRPASRAIPPKFSPEDKYGKYRRMLKASEKPSQ